MTSSRESAIDSHFASRQLERGLVVHCEVLTCAPPSELSFTWVVGDFLDTRVHYRLEAEGAGTRVRFEHAGFEQSQAFKGAAYGWKLMHGALETILEQGSGDA
ncbi:SRPBCC domain-containing protein [Pseudenhygromyxa sp. WMMC2535]|uniref:SRPBCC family protein n=1 Tax=Pseudenhygromyxa sp. WMMC2535 TaxID=2712867 RepID=UPI0020D07249|nr:SRPBCC domain-containing protein [Pseudenhygromyxa sp. WMMC2535]